MAPLLEAPMTEGTYASVSEGTPDPLELVYRSGASIVGGETQFDTAISVDHCLRYLGASLKILGRIIRIDASSCACLALTASGRLRLLEKMPHLYCHRFPAQSWPVTDLASGHIWQR